MLDITFRIRIIRVRVKAKVRVRVGLRVRTAPGFVRWVSTVGSRSAAIWGTL